MCRISIHTILLLCALGSESHSKPDVAYLSFDKLKTTQRFGDHDWRYHAGDDSAWATICRKADC